MNSSTGNLFLSGSERSELEANKLAASRLDDAIAQLRGITTSVTKNSERGSTSTSPPSARGDMTSYRVRAASAGTVGSSDFSSVSSSQKCSCCPFGRHQENVEDFITLKKVSQTQGKRAPSVSFSPVLKEIGSPEAEIVGNGLSSLNSSHTDSYSNKGSGSRNVIRKTEKTITSIADDVPGGKDSLTIRPEDVEKIKQHADDSNKIIRELQEQLKLVPQLQERIKSLKEDKRILAQQLQHKSKISSMRSIGVGDYDVEEDHIKVEKVLQKIVQEAPKPASRGIGVGSYDVNAVLYSEADISHTIAEHVKRIREKEIQTWIKEAKAEYEAKRASMRSFGVGDKNIWEDENRLIKEREMRTIVINQPEKPDQRNVGLQVKPSMRDVCIEYSHQEPTPLTRTCGFNVDIGDIMQEMSQNVDLTSTNQQSWTIQKHVIQRKFMDAMTTGNQEDLVKFITGLLKRSVRSVGTVAKPTTANFAMYTKTSSCERGVGNDVVDVIVKPFVHMKDNFMLARPATRTQPTWTDLVLTCDAGTNTQKHIVNKGVNTEVPSESEYSSTTEQTYVSTTKTTPPRNKRPDMSSYLGTVTTTKNFSSEYQPGISSSYTYKNIQPPGSNRSETVTETTVTRTTERDSVYNQPEMKYQSHLSKLVSPPPRAVEIDVQLPREYEEKQTVVNRTVAHHQTHPVLPLNHRSEMHMILPGRPDEITPLTVQVLPQKTTSGTNSEVVSSSHVLISSASGNGVTERELVVPVMVDETSSGQVGNRLLSSSVQVNPKPSSTVTKTVRSETSPHSTFKETTQLMESEDVTKKEVTIERRFSSGRQKTVSPNMSNSTDFDYFGKSFSNVKPTGHSDRMERYTDVTTYNTSDRSVDEERNKTELHGDPLKSRYSIDDMSGSSGPSQSMTITARSDNSSYDATETSSPRVRRRKSSVTFSDQVEKKYNFGEEFETACQVVVQHLQTGSPGTSSPKLNAALGVVQEKWFSIAGGSYADLDMGNSTLHYAVSHGNFNIARIIVKTGVANVNLMNKAGYTPVMLAAISELRDEDDRKAVRLLLHKGDLNVVNSKDGGTALMLAVSHGRSEMVELLTDAGTDVNIQDFDGMTALMYAAERDHVDIIQLLLQHPHIDVLLKDHDGSTALDLALENGYDQIAELLEQQERVAKASVPKNYKHGMNTNRSISRTYKSRFV